MTRPAFSSPRNPRDVLAIGGVTAAERLARMASDDDARKHRKNERSELLAALTEALDGWSETAGEDAAARISDLRARWGIAEIVDAGPDGT